MVLQESSYGLLRIFNEPPMSIQKPSICSKRTCEASSVKAFRVESLETVAVSYKAHCRFRRCGDNRCGFFSFCLPLLTARSLYRRTRKTIQLYVPLFRRRAKRPKCAGRTNRKSLYESLLTLNSLLFSFLFAFTEAVSDLCLSKGGSEEIQRRSNGDPPVRGVPNGNFLSGRPKNYRKIFPENFSPNGRKGLIK